MLLLLKDLPLQAKYMASNIVVLPDPFFP